MCVRVFTPQFVHHSNAAVQDAGSEPRCPSRHGAKASRAEGLRLNL